MKSTHLFGGSAASKLKHLLSSKGKPQIDPAKFQALISELIRLLAQLSKGGLNQKGASFQHPLPAKTDGVYYMRAPVEMDFVNVHPKALAMYLANNKPVSDGAGNSTLLIPPLK